MADVKWIKLSTNIFDNRKIKQIEVLPDGDSIIVMWIKLLCLAGSINDNGNIYFTKEIPYTDQMMATQFNMQLSTVQMALKVFEQFNMVRVEDNIMAISNWEKYQNIEGMEKIREQTRKRVANYRAKAKEITCNVTGNATVTDCNAIEEDIDKEKEKEEILSNTIDDIDLYLSDKTIYHVAQEDVEKWHSLYPDVDIISELKKMSGWLYVNISRRKTRRGIKSFINKWLSRNQDDFNANNKKRQMPNYDDEVVEVDNPEEERRKLIAQFKAANSK